MKGHKAKILGVVGHGGVHCFCCGGGSKSRSSLGRAAKINIRNARRRDKERAIEEGVQELQEYFIESDDPNIERQI
jgi:hypothetical protein